MPRIYRYVLVHDDGMAPCVDGGVISLATCKPVIRRCAEPGDWVLGFFPSPAPVGILAWAARVERKLSHGDYQTLFGRRRDAVYRASETGGFESLVPWYHPDAEQQRRDFDNGVLLFEGRWSWYFGSAPVALPDDLMHLAPRGQGHRVNGRQDGDGQRLLEWLEGLAPPDIHGKPRHRTQDGCSSRSCTAPLPKPRRALC